MTKKPVFDPAAAKTSPAYSTHLTITMPEVLRSQFYDTCKTTGLSANRLGIECIKFALEHMKVF